MKSAAVLLCLVCLVLVSISPDVFASGPQVVGSIGTPCFGSDVFVSGIKAYVTSCGVRVIDVSQPQSPQNAGTFSLPQGVTIEDIVLSGNYAYAAADTQGFLILDISNPNSPSVVGSVQTPIRATGIAVSGSHAYVTAWGGALYVIDISNPYAPRIVGTVSGLSWANDVFVSGSYAYVADSISGIHVIDVSTPASPSLVGTVTKKGIQNPSPFDNNGLWPDGVSVQGKHAFVTDSEGLQVIDITDLNNPVLKATVPFSLGAEHVFVSGRYAYVTGSGGTGTGMLFIVDVSAYAQSPKPSVTISLNQSQYKIGDTMAVTLSMAPGTADNLWDVYVALFLPDNSYIFMAYTPSYAFSASLIPARPLSAIGTESLQIFSVTLPPGLPLGSYKWASVLAAPGLSDFSEVSWADAKVVEDLPSSFDVLGTWSGSWFSSYGVNGTFTARVTQVNGTSLGGTIDVPYIGMFGASLKGTVDDDHITFGDVADTITFAGTMAEQPAGSLTASGTYNFSSIGDQGSWQGSRSGGSSQTTCTSMAGTWSVIETVADTTCSSTSGDQTVLTIVQDGCLLSLYIGSATLTGSISGSTASWSGSFSRDGGITTITDATISTSTDGSTMTGTAHWTWSNGESSCSGTTQVNGSRM